MRPPRAAALLTLLLASCQGASKGPPPAATTASAPSLASPPVSQGDGGSAAPRLPREGSAIARSPRGDALYVADEDHRVLRTVPLPLDPKRSAVDRALPGAPAQIVCDGDRVLVTIRDPGLLLVLRSDAAGLAEVARIPLPADAWGLTLTPDGTAAIVTSAWTHHVSAVDLAAAKVRWSVDVAREPRGVAVTPDGARAYVTHLVGPDLTRLDDLASASPKVRRVHLPVAPMRAREGVAEDATLAYGAALSPDGARLFVPRQALAADGKRAWAGQPVVDVLLTGDDSALAQRADGDVPYSTPELEQRRRDGTPRGGSFRDLTYSGAFPLERDPFLQPRAVLYRRSARTLLVASEGTDALVELDALAIEPAAHALRSRSLRLPTWMPKEGRERARVWRMYDGAIYTVLLDDGTTIKAWDETKKLAHEVASGRLVGLERRPHGTATAAIVELEPMTDEPGATTCGAPSGIALSEDERTAWVLCRSTDGVAEVVLDAADTAESPRPPKPLFVKLGDDALPAEAAVGRRLFYDASDPTLSGGLACAGCHPEGRDDGHVWIESTNFTPGDDAAVNEEDGKALAAGREPDAAYFSAPIRSVFIDFPGFLQAHTRGYPRQTPMLAGRVDARGPYGWHGRSPDLPSRILHGTALHRWPDGGELGGSAMNAKARATALAAFLRQGLVPPPREARALTEEEERGKAVFFDAKTGCTVCHVPATGYTDRSVVPFAAPPPTFTKAGPDKTHRDEGDRNFKTPSLLFVGGTPPYFHDGSAATLEDVIEKNHDRMGKTSHLSAADRAALAAFLRTL